MIKNMNLKINIIIIFIIISLFSTQNVSAHPPSKLNINYIEENNELIVNITHSVTTNDHYIESVEIKINGEKYDTYTYSNQPNRTIITYKYNITANTNDVIQVKAICNQFGTLTRELTVGGEKDNLSTPGFTIIFFILSILIMLFYFKIKN